MANGMSKLRIQAIYFTIGVLAELPVAWIFTKTLYSWIGVVLTNVLIMLPYGVIQHFANTKELKSLRRGSNPAEKRD
jgi:hypothetical protein